MYWTRFGYSLWRITNVRGGIQKFPDWVHNEITTTNTRWEATQRVMAAKLTRLTHKIVIQQHLVAESCTICSSRSRRPTSSYLIYLWDTTCMPLNRGATRPMMGAGVPQYSSYTTGWTTGVWFSAGVGKGYFSSSPPWPGCLEPNQPTIQWVTGHLSPRIKWPGRETGQSPPSSAEVKERVELYLCSPVHLHNAVLS
jgi:hypothetical protein